jgi:hypothetical protein
LPESLAISEISQHITESETFNDLTNLNLESTYQEHTTGELPFDVPSLQQPSEKSEFLYADSGIFPDPDPSTSPTVGKRARQPTAQCTWVSNGKGINLLKLLRINKGRGNSHLIAVCISSSCKTLAILTRSKFAVFSSPRSNNDCDSLKCTGELSKTSFNYGPNETYPFTQILKTSTQKTKFSAAALSDDYLCAGLECGTIMIFSISKGGECVREISNDSPGSAIHKMVMTTAGDVLAVILCNMSTQHEEARIYHIENLPNGHTECRQINSTSKDEKLDWNMRYMVTKEDKELEARYRTSDIAFSPNGKRIAICSNHVLGWALIRLLTCDPDWRYWGEFCTKVQYSDAKDRSLRGFTGISLYTTC